MSVPRPFRCSFCSQSFTRIENLERHKRSRHGASGSQNYECPLCHTVFNRRDICKRHRDRCDGRPSAKRARRTEIRVASRNVVVEDTETISPSHQPQPSSGSNQSSEPVLPEEEIMACVAAYFANFHQNFPILHRPTFSLASTPKPLMYIIVAIGKLFTHQLDPTITVEITRRDSTALWEASVTSLEGLAISDPGRRKDCWILQASLLCVVYGAFAAEKFAKSRHMLAALVADVREGGLFHQHMLGFYYSEWRQELDSEMSLRPLLLDAAWSSFVSEESLKLSIYGLAMIDLHLTLACNTRDEISPLEISWDLPWSNQCWEASTAELWWQQIVQDASSYQTIDGALSDRGPAMKSLYLATQSLLTDPPPPALLHALSSSYFALYCVTSNIYRLVRGFTHHLYQLPPNPSNPSPFHMLTHGQNSQISSALRIILSLKGVRNTAEGSDEMLWNAVEILCWATKISLCVPDDFLIYGIVDTDMAAALATAAHLSLGSQILGRRARNTAAVPRVFGEEGFLLILEELLNAMNTIVGLETQKAVKEAPWVSVVGFRVLLDLYRALRLATANIAEQDSLGTLAGTRSFDPAQVVYSTVKKALAGHIKSNRSLLSTQDLEQLGLLELTENSQICERMFMMLMILSYSERNVWAVGRAMVAVLEEISISSQV